MLSISETEIRERQQRTIKIAEEQNVDCILFFSVIDIIYLTGFNFRPSERPIAFLIDDKGDTHLFVPLLEWEHALEYAIVDNVHYYQEYPGEVHPMELLKKLLMELNFHNKVIGLDALGYSSPKGYEGPNIVELLSLTNYKILNKVIEKMRMVKSAEEVKLIKESCKWGNLAHKLLHQYSAIGKSELEISNQASQEASTEMIKTLGEDFKPYGEPASAFFRGQIGEHSYFPHSQPQNFILKSGNTLVTQAESTVFGYKSELERTMFVKEVTVEQEKYFLLMREAQEIAFNSIIPGQSFSTVEENVLEFYKANGVESLKRHHIGHNIGLLNHEAPFFDLGDSRIMLPGMVVTIEPGLYVKGLGGFRHSDTVLITEQGAEYLTYYPRDLEKLIVN